MHPQKGKKIILISVRAAIQRDLARLEESVDRKFMKFSKDK